MIILFDGYNSWKDQQDYCILIYLELQYYILIFMIFMISCGWLMVSDWSPGSWGLLILTPK